MTDKRPDIQIKLFQRACPDSVKSLTFRFAKCLRVEVALPGDRVFIGIFAENKARGVLVQVGGGKAQREIPFQPPAVAVDMHLALRVTRIRSESTIICINHRGQPWRFPGHWQVGLESDVVVFAHFQ